MKKIDSSLNSYYNNSRKDWKEFTQNDSINDNHSYLSTNRLNQLKESIKSSVKSFKKEKTEINEIVNIKTEKEKLNEYYASLKKSNKVNSNNDYISEFNNQGNDYVIYDYFKNVISKKKDSVKIKPDEYMNNMINISNIDDKEDSVSSIIKEFNNNVINENKNDQTTQTDENICRNTYCTYYKKNYKFFKNNFSIIKTKLRKEKKANEILNLKLFYETNKNINSIDRLNSTNVTKEENDKVKELYDKLAENINLFEKLENEIINKDLIINKQSETIKHQKNTIDKLLDQISFLLNREKLTNIEIKQNTYDYNLNKVLKNYDVINNNANEYSNQIKNFSENTKRMIEKNDEDTVSFNITDDKHSVKERDMTGIFDLTNTDRKFQSSTTSSKTNFIDHEIQDILNN